MLEILNPFTNKPIKSLATDNLESIQKKFASAKIAQKSWSQVPFQNRLEIIKKFREIVSLNKESLALTLTEEVGKPLSQSLNELNGLLTRIDFFIENSGKVLEPRQVFQDSNMTEQIQFEPLGVIANISAWNYPYFVGSNVFIPALLMGNSVLYKPSEYATLTGLAIEKMLTEAGLPNGVFTALVGRGAIGALLLEQKVNGVFFTGSYATGKKIAESVAGRMIKVQLELGGKDPAYVCEDANIQSAAESLADGAMYNAGQSCCSVERIYVHEKIYDAFVEAFVKVVKGFKIGDPKEKDTYIGPITRREHLAFLTHQTDNATKKGAKLLVGGHPIQGKPGFFEPTVLSNVNHTMEVMTEESFGPIIGIQKVTSDTEAISMMNDTKYGLTAGVYTPDSERAQKILKEINSGSVYWNCCDRVSPRLPWTGRGHSGIGSTLSTFGIETFLQPKAWHLRK